MRKGSGKTSSNKIIDWNEEEVNPVKQNMIAA